MTDPPLHQHPVDADPQLLPQPQQQEQIAALQRELAARDECVFDLQATLITVEAERVLQAQQAQSQIQLLQEQLRRTQHEANTARLAAARPTTTSHPPPVTTTTTRTTTATAAGPPRSTTTAVVDSTPWWESGLSTVPPPRAETRTVNELPPTHPSSPQPFVSSLPSFPIRPPAPQPNLVPSTGQRLARQLLLSATTTPTTRSASNPTTATTATATFNLFNHQRFQQELQQHLSRIVAVPSGTANANSLTEWDVIVWLVQELIDSSSSSVIDLSSSFSVNDDDPATATTAAGRLDDATMTTLSPRSKTFVLLQTLRDALTFSPSSCHLLRHVLASQQEAMEPWLPQQPPPRRRARASCLRIVSNTVTSIDPTAPSGSNNHTAPLYQRYLQQVEENLSSPLWKWHPSAAVSTTTGTVGNPAIDNDDDDTNNYGAEHNVSVSSPTHIRRVQRLVQVLADCACCRCDCVGIPQSSSSQPLQHPLEDEFHFALETAIVALQILQTIEFDYDTETNDKTHTERKNQENFDTPNFPNRLLTLWTTVVSEQYLVARFSTSSSNGNKASRRRTGSSRSLDQPTTVPLRLVCQSTTSHSFNSSDRKTPWEAIVTAAVTSSSSSPTNDWLLRWLTESLCFLRGVWDSASSQLRHEWLSQGLVANLLASTTDVLQHVIIPDAKLYSHSLTLAIVAWFQTLATTTTTSTTVPHDPRRMQSPTMRLLRTQQATTRTTTEQWHVAPTAVAVAVQLLYRVVVVEQNQHMPIPKAQGAALGNVIRDQVVRFLHALLQAVQHDRRQWERESSDNNHNNHKQRAPPLSFLTLLSECVEWYASAAALLLTMVPSETSRRSELYYNPCEPHPDIIAMIQMQLDELAEDQMEKLAMDE